MREWLEQTAGEVEVKIPSLQKAVEDFLTNVSEGIYPKDLEERNCLPAASSLPASTFSNTVQEITDLQ